MAIDQPTPPNIGNLTAAQHAALPAWAFVPINQPGVDDTYAAAIDCVNAVLWRTLNAYWAQTNEAFACRHITPLSLKISTAVAGLHWRSTDNGAQGLTLANLGTFAAQAPTFLFSCDATITDEVGGSIELRNTDPGDIPQPVYGIVSAGGSQGTGGTVVHGLRVSGGPGVDPNLHRYWYADQDTPAIKDKEILASVNVFIGWPQSNDGIIILKAANFVAGQSEIGATNRMAFEFGLESSFPSDFADDPSDLVLFLKWYDSGDVAQIARARVGINDPISIIPGREYTLGFQRWDDAVNSWSVRFYINGIRIGGDAQFDEPSAGTSTDIRLHVGSDVRGTRYVGGPINNVYILSSPPSEENDALMNTVYKIGAGHLVP